MKAIANGTLFLEDGPRTGLALLFEGETLLGPATEIPDGAEVVDAGGGIVAPGLVDVHCHGFMGWDASNGDAGELRAMSRQMARWGVTAWLPTTMTLPWPALERCFAAVRRAMAESAAPDWDGARVLGAHAEGPFISYEKRGAQDENAIQPPDSEKLRPWADAVRLMTVAPEAEGALPFIRDAVALGVRISMGHTAADTRAAAQAVEAGVTHATHLFNAMPPLGHREPGPVGVALASERVTCELIADTFHVNPLLFGALYRAKGDRLALITDSIQVAHLPDGPHDQAGRTVIVDGIRCRFPDGTIAGSSLTLDRAVRNFALHAKIPLWEAARAASLAPARAVGADGEIGSLRPGKRADFLICDPDFRVRQTWIGGRRVCGASDS